MEQDDSISRLNSTATTSAAKQSKSLRIHSKNSFFSLHEENGSQQTVSVINSAKHDPTIQTEDICFHSINSYQKDSRFLINLYIVSDIRNVHFID